MSLARRLSTQAFWALAGQLATTVIGFIGFVVMVRILEMQDYGIFALAMLVVGLAEILVGQHTAGIIVQHDGLERRHENASLVVLVVFAAVSATGIFAVADAAASWFDEPALADLLRVVAILPILSALTQVPQQLLVRRLSFDTLAFGSGLAATCAILTGVALAFWGAGFWSLFGMEIVRRLVLLTHCVSKAGWRPGLEHRSHHLVEVLRFATKRIENEGLAYIAGNALPRGAVGQFLGAEALGLFDVAKRLLERVREILIGPIGRVTFPAAARLQTDPVRMQRLIEASIRISTWVFWPTVLGLIALAPQFVPLILGPRWEAAVPVFQLLAVAALRAPVYAVNKSVLTATAWLKAITTIHLIRIGLGLALIPIGLQAGVVGVAAALALRQWLIWPVVANYVHRACGLAPRRQLTVLLRAALPSIGMTAMLYAALWWQGGGGAPVADLAVYSVAGGLAYLLLWSLANMHEARHLMGAARSFLQGDRGRMKAQLSEVLQ